MIAEELKKLIGQDVKLEHPVNLTHGDYAFHARGKATELVEKINKEKPDWLEKVEVVGSFVNFFLSPKFFVESIAEINKEKENFGRNFNLKDKKVIIEYTYTNVLKPLH